MLKKRIIPVQLLVDGRLVKTSQFGQHRDVGDPIASSRVYNAQNCDELVFLNIDRASRNIRPLMKILERVSEVCFMPLALGGGISSFDDAASLIRHGADKVVVNTHAFRNIALISEISRAFGAQAVIASIDARRTQQGTYIVCSNCGRDEEPVSLQDHVRNLVDAGAGEVLIQSIDRDGTMAGYDIELVRQVHLACIRPVIALGGAGNYDHLLALFKQTNVSAAACGSLFNFGDNNPLRAKAHLSNHGLPFKSV